MATWDNHDYGTHDGGTEFPLKKESQTIFLDFFGEPDDSKRRRTPGIYDAKILGPPGRRVQIILLDTRFFKDRYKIDPTPKTERLKMGKVGGYLIAGPITAHNFGLVEIDWDAKPSPMVTLKVIGEGGHTGFSHQFRIDELRSSKISGEEKLIDCPDPRAEECTQKTGRFAISCRVAI